jgi:hypothetical protein
MSIRLEDKAVVRRRTLPLGSLRHLLNRTLSEQTDCHGVLIRRIIVTETDNTGCNWQPEWPLFRPASIEPCRSQLRAVVEQLRMRYNVER